MQKWLIGFVLVFAALFGSAAAADKPQAVIVFDASGSMWGQINGVPKIVIARDALKNVVKEWNPDVELGLTVYGHRTKGDCSDIENIIPVGSVDKKKIIDTVMAIKPKGKTPISRSLKKAADELKYTEEKATVILISDGKETCDPDPCAAAKELRKQGIDFITHVIGFNVDKKTDKELECIAHATGGEYFSAKDAASLNKAIKIVAKKVEVAPPAPKETVFVPVVRYDVFPDGQDLVLIPLTITQNGKTVYQGDDTRPELKIEPGSVHVKAVYNGKASVSQTIEQDFGLKAGERNFVKVLIKSGTVVIDAREEEGSPKVKASVHIYPVIDGEADLENEMTWCIPTRTESCERILPIGDYLAKASYSGIETRKAFSLADKEKRELHLIFRPTGKVAITVMEKEGGKLVEASGNIYRKIDGEVESSSFKSAYVSRRGPKIVRLPVGSYVYKVSYNTYKREVPFEIKAGKTLELPVVMGQTGKIEASASEKEGGRWINAGCRAYKIVDGEVDSSDSWGVYPRKKKPGTVQLPTGKYKLKCEYNAFKKETTFEVKSGETTKVHLVFSPFFISAKCPNAGEKVSYEIYGSDGRLVFDKKMGCSDSWKVILDDGDYSIEAVIDSGKGEVKFSVGAGKPNRLIVDLSNLNHEAEIKADAPEEAVVVQATPKKETQAVEPKEAHSSQSGKIDINEIKKSLGELGAMVGGLKGAQKMVESKPLEGIKESLKVALPYMEKSKSCYEAAKTLDEAKLCDVITNEGAVKAQEKMEEVVGIKGQAIKKISQKEWGDEIKAKKLEKARKEIRDAKLYIVCIDKGAGMTQLKECAANNGEFVPKKNEIEQLGEMLKMFGGMK